MPSYRDTGIVLHTHPLGEADRIVTVLTREHGRVRAVARGVRRTGSRFGGRLEPMVLADIQFHQGRSLDSISQAESLAAYGADLAADYSSWTTGQAMCETAARLTPEEREPATQQFLLLLSGLRSLSAAEHATTLVLDAYLVRSLAVAGWAASFADCARCGSSGPHKSFSLAGGGALCVDCRSPGSAAPRPETLRLLGALLTGDWVVADGSDPRSRTEASGLVAAYLQWHLERGLKSLPLVDRGGPASPAAW
ncbi:MAG: DNA repair protein RecO [Candidatus Nanopelagicales bacterium]